MLLAIDCGNTNTVFSIWDGEKWLCTLRTSTHHSRTADAYFTWFSTLISHYKIKPDITDIVISSTVPRVVWNLRVFSDRFFNCRPLVVGKPECLLPVAPVVDPGTGVGPDRLANAAGCYNRHGGNAMVIDFGTATTFDVMDGDGNYRGGIIAPGINLSVEALYRAAAKLPLVEIKPTKTVIGKSTIPAMQSGIFWGYVGLVRELTSRVRAEYGQPMKVIGTGGLAPLFAQGAELFDTIEDDLTMHGLRVINDYNKEQGKT